MSKELRENYYLVKFKILEKVYYTFWYTDNIDGFLLDIDGMIMSFPTKEEAIGFAKEKGFLLNREETEYLISPEYFRKIEHFRKIDCGQFLNYLNIFSDVAHSINCQFIGDSRKGIIQHIYTKLFYGCNILVKEKEEHYKPKWNKEERRWIIRVIKDGFRILSKGLNKTGICKTGDIQTVSKKQKWK